MSVVRVLTTGDAGQAVTVQTDTAASRNLANFSNTSNVVLRYIETFTARFGFFSCLSPFCEAKERQQKQTTLKLN